MRKDQNISVLENFSPDIKILL